MVMARAAAHLTPMARTADTFPTIPQAAVLLLANFLLQFGVGVALQDHRRSLGLDDDHIAALAMLVANGLLLVTVLQIQQRSHRDLLHSSASSAWVTTVLLVPPTLLLVPLVLHLDMALSSLLARVLPLSPWEEQAFANMVNGSLGSVVAACVLAPLLEEMLFRGVLLRSFLAQYPRGQAISASALLFGVAHLNIYQFALAFWLGLLLGWLYERSRSLIPCIALHAALNTWVVVSSSPGQGASADAAAFTPATWAAALLAAVLGGALLHRLLLRPRARPPTDRG